jgi:heat shock protein HtpX
VNYRKPLTSLPPTPLRGGPGQGRSSRALVNRFKTGVLLATLGGLIVTVAGVLGNGSSGALTVGLVLALVMVGGSYWFSDRLALRAARARIVERSENAELFAMVERLAASAGLPMPRVAVSPSLQPNAFATGRNPAHAVVCATTGLLETLPARQVEAVMAHELMHVKNRDILIGSVAAAIATAISYVTNIVMFASFMGGSEEEDRPNPLALLAVTLLAPIAAALIQMAVSRSREFEADRGAAELLGSGDALADALERIESIAVSRPMAVTPAQAQAYIHNPLAEARSSGAVRMARLFSTHPDTAERVRRLRGY